MPLPILLLAAAAAAPPEPAGMPDGARLGAESACYTINLDRDGASKPIGVTWQTVRRRMLDDRYVLEVVVHQSVNNGAVDMKDEFTLDASTLGPLRLVNYRQGKVHVRLDYAQDRIRGERFAADGRRLKLDIALPGPVWDGNLYGLTFAALPLAEGATFKLPYWQYDKGFGEFTVQVVGSEQVATPDGPVDAWVLDAGATPGTRMTYLIGKASHRELGYRAGPGSQTLGGDCTALQTADAALPAKAKAEPVK